MSIRTLSNVPEEDLASSSLLYNLPTASTSSSTFHAGGPSTQSQSKASSSSRRPPSGRMAPGVRESGHSSKRSSNATASNPSSLQAKTLRPHPSIPCIRSTPQLLHDKDAERAPSTAMYWSRAPVYGAIPMRTMRAHSVTLVDTTAWLFGGCDDKESSKDIYCFDIETMQWTHPDTTGDIPPPCRAHTATLVDRKIIVFGGGQGPLYYDAVYMLDTTTRRWSRPKLAPGPHPAPRRAHTAVFYKGKIWVFGGGNGLTALNDVWTLDVGMGPGAGLRVMRWEEVQTTGKKPGSRGYHTANLIGNIMVVVGGSDGKECFTDIWCLNLDSKLWTIIPIHPSHRRLAHSSTQVGSYLFIVGGHNSAEYGSELLAFNLVSLQYEPRITLGKQPSPRGYHATLLADSRLFLFGGYNGSSAFDDVYILDLAAGAYLPQVTSFTIDI